MARLTAIVAAAVALSGCGGDDEPKTVTQTRTETVEAENPATTEKARPKRDPAEKRNELFLSIDDQAVAADRAIGFALDGQENAVRTLNRIRKRLLDKNLELLLVDESLEREMNGLIGAVTDAKVAAEAGDIRGLVEARVATQDAREALTEAVVRG